MNQNFIYCGQSQFKISRGQIYCCECATVQPRFLVNDYLGYKITQKITKKNYEKKGVQSYLKTEYQNIIKEFNVEGSKEFINLIIDLNEKFVKTCKQIFFSIVRKKDDIKESFFKRNNFLNQNVILFFVLVSLKRFDVLNKILDRFKYSESLKLKKFYVERKEKVDLRNIKCKSIQFIWNLLDHQEEESQDEQSVSLLNQI